MLDDNSPDRESPPEKSGKSSDVFNDRGDVGSVGKARSSGGIGAAGFVREGMAVIGQSGKELGTVDRVEGDRIWLKGDANNDGKQEFVPFALVDGVDDERVILSDWNDGSY
ncbi:MAG: DUF2171 domain-containing protein [Sphingomonadaceae bacterium]